MRLRFLGAALGFSALLLAAHSARADAIDGAWCHAPAQRMMINGPSIVTPAGTKTQGDYTRHAFSYVVPAGDPGAGTTIQMRLLSEEAVQVRAGESAPVETWLRCGPAVSARPTPRVPA
ncbi:hypothetical protein [Limobrevibacterium gyesilva]|uniref:Uncharacterized protein n=1 Tax=Limobrevibacterium gyesilva TaxID=2991712 RepID=A0AA42CCI8_9PROT|nr:hypothetical protein [Limobrevibacterium gyesilva]MCW3473433.1 hypothetical protein [Limobrevibacterium gyesilva]